MICHLTSGAQGNSLLHLPLHGGVQPSSCTKISLTSRKALREPRLAPPSGPRERGSPRPRGGPDAEGRAQNRTQTGVKRKTVWGRGQNGSRKQVWALQGCRGDLVTWRIGGFTLSKGLGVGWADPGDRHSPAVSGALKDL